MRYAQNVGIGLVVRADYADDCDYDVHARRPVAVRRGQRGKTRRRLIARATEKRASTMRGCRPGTGFAFDSGKIIVTRYGDRWTDR